MSIPQPEYPNVIGPSWKGFSNVKNLFIFGDSLSAVGAPYKPMPTRDEPLGIEFPGITYNEPDLPNWVGFLASDHHSMLVYDYARGGHTCKPGLTSQVNSMYLPYAGTKPDYTKWSEHDSMFVTWIGTNDSARHPQLDVEGFEIYQEVIFDHLEKVYETGGRNFLFVDLPPLNNAPGFRAAGLCQKRFGTDLFPYEKWNVALNTNVRKFVAAHPDATVFVFSSYKCLDRVFAAPSQYGFDAARMHDYAGPVWTDHIHPTSAIHAIVARDIAAFLQAQAPDSEV